MRTAIDRSGRVIVPKVIRDKLGLGGGETLEIEERDGVIELRVAPIEVELIFVNGVLTANPLHDVDPLDDDTVHAVRQSVRR
jgi:AbrB family looped-hinge helix DNA binding protein